MARPDLSRKGGASLAQLFCRPDLPRDLPFDVLEICPVGLKNLVGQFKIGLPSGLVLRCNLVRNRKGELSVFPAAHRSSRGNFQAIVEFASPQVKERWEALVFEALEPYMHHFQKAKEACFDERF